MDDQQSKVAVITGCSSGIGLALAREFKQQGLRVFATARRKESLEQLEGEGFETVALDITGSVSVQNAVKKVIAEATRIDFLINNAGHSLFGPLAELSLEDVEKVLYTNCVSQLRICQAVVPVMAKQGSGCIVNIGSIVGLVTTPFVGAYSASKAALHSMSEALRMEVAPFGIDVVVVQPGAVRSQVAATGINHSALERYNREDSLYYPVKEQIAERASASQDKPTEAEEFARLLVKKLLQKKIPKTIRLGNGTGFLSVLAKLPMAVRDAIFSKHYQLDRLKK